MRNWSTNTIKFSSPEEKAIWELEQKVNFGLGEGEILDRRLLVKFWPKLNIDPDRKAFLKLILENEHLN